MLGPWDLYDILRHPHSISQLYSSLVIRAHLPCAMLHLRPPRNMRVMLVRPLTVGQVLHDKSFIIPWPVWNSTIFDVVRPCQAQGGRKKTVRGRSPRGRNKKKQRPKSRRSNWLCTVGCQSWRDFWLKSDSYSKILGEFTKMAPDSIDLYWIYLNIKE